MRCCYYLVGPFCSTLKHFMQFLLSDEAWICSSRCGCKSYNGYCSVWTNGGCSYLNCWATRASILNLWNVRWSTTINFALQDNHVLLHLLKNKFEHCIVIILVLLNRTLSGNGWNWWRVRCWGLVLWIWLVNWLCHFFLRQEEKKETKRISNWRNQKPEQTKDFKREYKMPRLWYNTE